MKKLFFIFGLVCVLAVSCRKDRMELKPSSSLVVPTTLQDLQALLDNAGVMNVVPALGEMGSDDYYLDAATWNALFDTEKNAYVWAEHVFSDPSVGDWNSMYEQVFYANVVLEGIENIAPGSSNRADWRNVKGEALFFRAHAFYHLAQLFGVPYNESTASSDWGIPLRLSADLNKPSNRATLRETYDQIIADLLLAKGLLPLDPVYKTRPSKPAADALLARVFLLEGEHERAFLYADSCLRSYDQLIDYSTLDAGKVNPLPRFNEEVIFHSTMLSYRILTPSTAKTDSGLFALYDQDDLRRTVFFESNGDGSQAFGGSYDGTTRLFGGISTGEAYLIRAECAARKGNTHAALNDLNLLLASRWETGTFEPLTASGPRDALLKALQERRKELLFRGRRWDDLRRLNREEDFASVLTRRLDEQTYTLPPNDDRYTYPVPEEVISLNPGMPQNNR